MVYGPEINNIVKGENTLVASNINCLLVSLFTKIGYLF